MSAKSWEAQPIWKQRFEFVTGHQLKRILASFRLLTALQAQEIIDASLAIMMLMAWDQDVDFDDLLGRRPRLAARCDVVCGLYTGACSSSLSGQYAFPLAELKPGWRRCLTAKLV